MVLFSAPAVVAELEEELEEPVDDNCKYTSTASFAVASVSTTHCRTYKDATVSAYCISVWIFVEYHGSRKCGLGYCVFGSTDDAEEETAAAAVAAVTEDADWDGVMVNDHNVVVVVVVRVIGLESQDDRNSCGCCGCCCCCVVLARGTKDSDEEEAVNSSSSTKILPSSRSR